MVEKLNLRIWNTNSLLQLVHGQTTKIEDIVNYMYGTFDKYTTKAMAIIKSRLLQKVKLKIKHKPRIGYCLETQLLFE